MYTVMSALPSPVASGKSYQHTSVRSPLLLLLSLFTIALVMLSPAPRRSSSHSKFAARIPIPEYTRPRRLSNYPWGKVCSPKARRHFRSRFSRPRRPTAPKYPRTLLESENRVFMSAVPHEVGDGLGHRTCILNYELNMALTLGLTYSHRQSSYGSLTRDDPEAVENLFGWGAGEISRDYILDRGCLEVDYVNDTCEIPSPNIICRRVRTRRKGGLFDQTVIIPDEIAECFLQKGPEKQFVDQNCYPLVQSFLAAYSDQNTLFQMHPKLCFRDYLFTNFSKTADWFAEKYWTNSFQGENDSSIQLKDGFKVANIAKLSSTENTVKETRRRNLSLEQDRVHIALHIRRGDFFNYTNRVLIPDSTYADVSARVKIALDEMVNADVPTTVHIFSEGVANGEDTRTKDNHDTSTMRAVYVNEHGQKMPSNYWNQLFRHQRRLSGTKWRHKNLDVKLHIATDTIQAVHDMLASDFFIGSISGLSMQVVRNIARGIVFLPLHETEIEEDELVIPFDYERNAITSFVNETRLYELVAKQARRNRLSCSVW